MGLKAWSWNSGKALNHLNLRVSMVRFAFPKDACGCCMVSTLESCVEPPIKGWERQVAGGWDQSGSNRGGGKARLEINLSRQKHWVWRPNSIWEVRTREGQRWPKVSGLNTQESGGAIWFVAKDEEDQDRGGGQLQ
jgi:hypothetical protein